MMERKKVIIDCDPGADDGLALMLALQAENLDIQAVTVVAGNRSVDLCVQNAMKIMEHYERLDIPVYRGCEKPLKKPLCLEDSDFYSGRDGMAEIFLPYKGTSEQTGHGVDMMEKLILQHSGEIHIISIAPMTNIASVFLKNESVASKVASIITINGAYGVNRTPDHVNARREWNISVDPDAARVVLESGVPVYAMGVDVTEQLQEDMYERLLFNSVSGTLPHHYLQEAGRFLRQRNISPAGLFVDVMALAYAMDERLACFVPGKVQVECTGDHTAGMTIFDNVGNIRNSSQIAAAYQYDFEALEKLLIEKVFK